MLACRCLQRPNIIRNLQRSVNFYKREVSIFYIFLLLCIFIRPYLLQLLLHPFDKQSGQLKSVGFLLCLISLPKIGKKKTTSNLGYIALFSNQQKGAGAPEISSFFRCTKINCTSVVFLMSLN